jgi:APA family basic amino acid/polyamine antiporter
MSQPKERLRRELGLFEMISLTAGAVIGGWLAEAPYWFELTGAGNALLFLPIAVLLIPVGLAIAELTSMFPYAAGPLAFTYKALGVSTAFWTHWMFFLVQVIEPPLMVFIWASIIKYFYGIEDFATVKLLTIILLIIWFAISMYRIGFIGKLANIVFVTMIVAPAIIGVAFFLSGHWSTENMVSAGGWFPNGVTGAMLAMAVLVLKYIGFEFAPVFAEEVKFPRKEFWKPVLLSLIIPALLYTFASLAMAGMAPWNAIASMDLPEPRIVEMYALPAVLIYIAIVAGFLHAFSTMAGFWLSSARALYGFAQLGFLPNSLLKTNKYGQPWIANIIVFLLSLMFVAFTPVEWVQYVYAISCVAAGILYLVIMIDWLVMRTRYKDMPREYKAPGGLLSFVLGSLMSAWIAIGSSFTMPMSGWYAFAIFIVIGIFVWLIGLDKQKKGEWTPEIKL